MLYKKAIKAQQEKTSDFEKYRKSEGKNTRTGCLQKATNQQKIAYFYEPVKIVL
jgi:hypothetical protein